jgi:hypothetical protein
MIDRSVVQRVVSVAGDPFAAAATPLAEMTYSQRDKFLREAYAPEYREHLRRIIAAGVTDEEDGVEA